jgi:hypothetical protein
MYRHLLHLTRIRLCKGPGYVATTAASSSDKVKGTWTSDVSHLVVMPPESVLLV